MDIDLAILALAAAMGMWGVFTGAKKQLPVFLALPLGYVASHSLGDFYGVWVATKLGLHAFVGGPLVCAVSVVLIFLALKLGLHLLMRTPKPLGIASRAGGFALGAVQVPLLGVLALSALPPYELSLAGSAFHASPDESVAVALSRRTHLYDASASRLPVARPEPVAAKEGGSMSFITNPLRSAESAKKATEAGAERRARLAEQVLDER